MNPNYTEFKFPQIKAHPWSKVFSKRLPTDAVDLVRHLADSSVPSSDFHVTHVRVLGRRDQCQFELQPLKCKLFAVRLLFLDVLDQAITLKVIFLGGAWMCLQEDHIRNIDFALLQMYLFTQAAVICAFAESVDLPCLCCVCRWRRYCSIRRCGGVLRCRR